MSDCGKDPLYTPLCGLLGCEVPILLAGMGGVSRWELAAAVANAGGYGMLGMVREDPALIAAEVSALRAETDRPFAVNLIPAATEARLLDAQITCCLDLGVPAFTFFWDVMPDVVDRVKRAGCLVLHQVGTVEAAKIAEDAGADVIIAQGVEAGGHVHGRIPAFELAERILGQTNLPVVVSGGIATGEGLSAALAIGASGVQCGTAFLATDESYAHPYHKSRIVESTGDDTVLTDVFVLNWPKGAAVRVIANSVTDGLHGDYLGHDPDSLPHRAIAWDGDQPRLRFSTDSPLRTTTGDLEAMALYAGRGAGDVKTVSSAANRLNDMVAQARHILNKDSRTPPQDPSQSDAFDSFRCQSGFSSPPCYAAEIAPDYFDPLAVDPEQARDVARWRTSERKRLRNARLALPVAKRKGIDDALSGHLDQVLQDRFDGARGRVFSAYWPIKGEPDLRPLMAELHRAGVTVALPLVETKAAPLTFRRWTPETRMVRGDWSIPVPPPDAPIVTPDIALAPLMGWTASGYRLGYGGGYFDRTLAALTPKPFVIGIGFEAAQLSTIYPQPHDIPLDLILTEFGARSEQTEN